MRLLALLIALIPCCSLQAQISLKPDNKGKWVGWVDAVVQPDGSIVASLDSKPAFSTTISRHIVTLDAGYTLEDLEVEALPALEFVEPTLTQIDGNKLELKLDRTGNFRAKARLDYGGKKVTKRFNFTIGDVKPPPKPDDPPGPAPTPTPDGVNPFGLPGLRVMIVYESRSGVPRQYTGDVRAYLDSKCVKDGANGIPQRLVIDQNSSFAPGSELWQKVMARGQKSLPWIVIGKEGVGYEGPLPSSAAGVLELLKKYGG